MKVMSDLDCELRKAFTYLVTQPFLNVETYLHEILHYQNTPSHLRNDELEVSVAPPKPKARSLRHARRIQ